RRTRGSPSLMLRIDGKPLHPFIGSQANGAQPVLERRRQCRLARTGQAADDDQSGTSSGRIHWTDLSVEAVMKSAYGWSCLCVARTRPLLSLGLHTVCDICAECLDRRPPQTFEVFVRDLDLE